MLYLALFVIALFAFATQTAIGFGANVLAVSLAIQFLPLDRFLPAMVPVTMLLSVWILVADRRRVAWRALFVEVVPLMGVGAVVGLALFRIPARRVLELVFALSVILLAVVELRQLRETQAAGEHRPFGARRRRVVLLLAGVTHGLFGSGGPLAVYVLRRRFADKTVFRGTLAALWIAMNCALLANYASMHLLSWGTARLAAPLAAAVVPGILVGERLHRALAPRTFHRIVLVVLLVAGCLLAVRVALALTGR